MRNFKLNPEELQSLRAIHKVTKDKWAADRMKALLALGGGWTLEEVSEILLLDTETLRNYIKLYQNGGVEELTQRHYKGSTGKLSKIEREELKAHLSEAKYLSVAAIKKHIEKAYKVTYTVSGLTDLLHQLGFVYKKPDKRLGVWMQRSN